MARVSRKINNTILLNENIYRAGVYVRLSNERTESWRNKSQSIESQIFYCKEYAKKFGITVFKIYKDYEFSGTNFERPAYKEMIEDIKNYKINCIIVRDLSRLGREYLEMGLLIEKVFPFLGVRFISIDDNLDSLNKNEFQNSVDIRFKTLLYDFYSKDISNKVKSTSNKLKREGKFLSWSPPYGYIKDPNNKHKIIIDKKTSEIVKRIFEMANENKSSRDIAKILNSENVITPSNRKKQTTFMNYSYLKVLGKNHKDSIWIHDNVLDILHNEIYIGTYVFNKFASILIGSNHKKRIKQEEWERVLNNPDPIITKELFSSVQ